MTCKAGVEKRYNEGLTAIATVAEEDVQVVGKQLDQSMVGQFAKMYRQLFKKKLGNLNLSSQELLFKMESGVTPDFFNKFKNYVKKC